jgi:hypothetical protein
MQKKINCHIKSFSTKSSNSLKYILKFRFTSKRVGLMRYTHSSNKHNIFAGVLDSKPTLLEQLQIYCVGFDIKKLKK